MLRLYKGTRMGCPSEYRDYYLKAHRRAGIGALAEDVAKAGQADETGALDASRCRCRQKALVRSQEWGETRGDSMLWWRLKTFLLTVAILLIGTAALANFYDPFVSKLESAKLGVVNNVAVVYGLLALSYAPLAVAILLFGFALSYAFSFRSRLAAGLFVLLSALLIGVGAVNYVTQPPYSLEGTTVHDKWTYHLVKANQFREERFALSLCECEISSLACQCHEFYTGSSPTVGMDLSLVPDKAAGEMQVWLNGKLLHAYRSPP